MRPPLGLALALVIVAMAACQGESPTATHTVPAPPGLPQDTPTPSPTPTPEPTSTPQPTPTPTIDPRDALARVREAMREIESYRFNFTVRTGDDVTLSGSGAWVTPGYYALNVSEPLCPPVFGGAPTAEDCGLFLTYREVSVDDQVQRFYGGPSRLEGFGLARLADEPSPAEQFLDALESDATELRVSPLDVDGATFLEIMALPRNAMLLVDQHSYVPRFGWSRELAGDLVQWDWEFEGHDEPIGVALYEPPEVTSPPWTWFESKRIRLIESDPRFPAHPIYPFHPEGDLIAEELVAAVGSGSVVSAQGVTTSGAIVKVHFTDGTGLSISPAASAASQSVLFETYYISGAGASVVRSPALSAWWAGLDDYFPLAAGLVEAPTNVRAGEAFEVAGNAWPGETVVLEVWKNGKFETFATPGLDHGSFTWRGPLPDGVELGEGQLRVRVPDRSGFLRRDVVWQVAVGVGDSLKLEGRPVEVVWMLAGTSDKVLNRPLWTGLEADRAVVDGLLDALRASTPSAYRDVTLGARASLHVGHVDGSETVLIDPVRCSLGGVESTCPADVWLIEERDAAGAPTGEPRILSAQAVANWWARRADYMPSIQALGVRWNGNPGTGMRIDGDGWVKGDSVTLTVDGGEGFVEQVHTPLYFGAFEASFETWSDVAGAVTVTAESVDGRTAVSGPHAVD